MISRTDTALPTDYVIESTDCDPLTAILENPALSAECKAGAVVLAAGGAPTRIGHGPTGITRRWGIRTLAAPHGSVAAILSHHA